MQDRAGDTNLIIASKAGHKTIVEALIKRYADVDTKVGMRNSLPRQKKLLEVQFGCDAFQVLT